MLLIHYLLSIFHCPMNASLPTHLITPLSYNVLLNGLDQGSVNHSLHSKPGLLSLFVKF